MPISLKMPALSPTMEEGTLAKWLVKKGDKVEAGDLIAEIETDKATMEFEAIDDGTITELLVAEGSEGVKVGTDIALITGDDEDSDADEPDAKAKSEPDKARDESKGGETKDAQAKAPGPKAAKGEKADAPATETASKANGSKAPAAPRADGDRVKASPLARRIAQEKGADLTQISGSGPGGRIVKADVDAAEGGQVSASAKSVDSKASAESAPADDKPRKVEMADETRAILDPAVPHDVQKLSGMRKTIAKRLTQSMQDAPHIYLTVDIRLDKLLEARKQLNAALESRKIKLSVNDLLIKALGKALMDVPECNVAFAGNELIRYSRADVSVAVSIEGGLITPIVRDADGRSISEISEAMSDLGKRAKQGKLKADEYQGGTASLSNMGMMGIKQFTAVINPPQAAIIAVGAGEQRAIVENGELAVATMMSATGSFDHRAIDGADGARLMAALKRHVENPLGMLA